MSDKRTKTGAENVPLGNGLADRARRAIMGRRSRIDAAVEAAVRGNGEAARLRRMREGQSTDSSQ